MKKKGFTLIELLAVLVILAILALITIPIVLSIIRNAKENSYKRSIESYGRSVENAIMEYRIANGSNSLPTKISEYDVKTSGYAVKCDDEIRNIENENGITLTNCHVIDSKNNPQSKKYKYHNGTLIEGEIFKEYNVGDEITLFNEKYHVIENSSETTDYVTLFKDKPLTVAEVNLYGGSGTDNNHVNRYTVDTHDTARNINGWGGIAYYSSENCGYAEYTYSSHNYEGCHSEEATSYQTSDVKYVVDNWANEKFSNNELKLVDGYMTRIITKEELRKVGYQNCNENDNYCSVGENSPSWIHPDQYKYAYWTMTPDYTDNKYSRVFLDYTNAFSSSVVYQPNAVRPVINIYKSAIK